MTKKKSWFFNKEASKSDVFTVYCGNTKATQEFFAAARVSSHSCDMSRCIFQQIQMISREKIKCRSPNGGVTFPNTLLQASHICMLFPAFYFREDFYFIDHLHCTVALDFLVLMEVCLAQHIQCCSSGSFAAWLTLWDGQHGARVCLSRVDQLEHHVIAVNDKGVKNLQKMGLDANPTIKAQVYTCSP